VDKYAKIYLEKLASECKEAGLGDILSGLGGFAKTVVVDPLTGMYTNTRDAIGAASRGDWADAGSKALGALGDTAYTALNATMLVPGIGTGIGLGGRALLGAGRALSAANKVKGVATAAKGINAAGSAITNAGKAVNTAGMGLRNFGHRVPGGEWLGFAKPKPGFMGGLVKPTLKMLPFQVATGGGSYLLGRSSLRSQFDDLAVDPNFREWMGPDRQDAWLENARTDGDKVTSMRELKNRGYLDVYKKHLKNTTARQRQLAEDEARLDDFERRRKENLG